MNGHGLGRIASPDSRDHRFLLTRPRLTVGRTTRTWYDNGWWGDQGATSQCVGYAWAHFIEDSPKTHPDPNKSAYIDPRIIYRQAQLLDEWPGENDDGTSVRAGAKYLQQQGLIGEYLWAFDPDTVAANVLEVGPVVMGTDWYTTMFNPDPKGILHIDGWIAGGHAYVINGYNKTKKLFRVKNSWGREWGIHGRAYIRYDDLARLLTQDGEACLAVEP